MAILEEVLYPKRKRNTSTWINKSVFSEDELKSFYRERKYKAVLKLLFLRPFDRKVNLDALYQLGIFQENEHEAPRLSSRIYEKQARMIIEKGNEQ